jgi:hypothetical protein
MLKTPITMGVSGRRTPTAAPASKEQSTALAPISRVGP